MLRAAVALGLKTDIGLSSFGDSSCWVDDLRFLACCSVKVFGPKGNDVCWSEDLGLTFERCCLREGARDEVTRSLDGNASVARSETSFEAAVVELARFVHRNDFERHSLGGQRPLRPQERELLTELNHLIVQWRSGQLIELASQLWEVMGSYSALESSSHQQQQQQQPIVGILLACTPDSAGSSVCQLGANLWQCYALRHRHHFIFDTTSFPTGRERFRFGHWPSAQAIWGRYVPQALHDNFGADDLVFLDEEPLAADIGSDGLTFKWWQRWYAARRYLQSYDYLLIVDPDTSVFPTCVVESLLQALRLDPEDSSNWPAITVREPREGEDMNGGVFGLTKSPWALLFLDLLLARSRWPLDMAGGGGWCQARQAAEYESLLEVVALVALSATGRLDYAGECMAHAVPQPVLDTEGTLSAGCIWAVYLQCWKKVVQRLRHTLEEAGAPTIVRFLSPEDVDINYRPWSNEPRYRPAARDTQSKPPIENPAFLWHYVGIPDKVGSMLNDFGLSSIENTIDCQALAEIFANASLPACTMAGSRRPCPYEDSDLMPMSFGC